MSSKTTTGADNQQERLNSYWIVGFVDGEGCFSVSCNRNKTAKFNYQLFPEFVITQSEKSVGVLKNIQKFFGCGKIFINHRIDNHRELIYRYCVRSINELVNKIIPFFNQYPLKTAKRNDFNIFCQIVSLMAEKKHLQADVFQSILKLKSQMNRKKTIRI